MGSVAATVTTRLNLPDNAPIMLARNEEESGVFDYEGSGARR
jgi:hypothetical protein